MKVKTRFSLKDVVRKNLLNVDFSESKEDLSKDCKEIVSYKNGDCVYEMSNGSLLIASNPGTISYSKYLEDLSSDALVYLVTDGYKIAKRILKGTSLSFENEIGFIFYGFSSNDISKIENVSRKAGEKIYGETEFESVPFDKRRINIHLKSREKSLDEVLNKTL